jgi:hypothetical protein
MMQLLVGETLKQTPETDTQPAIKQLWTVFGSYMFISSFLPKKLTKGRAISTVTAEEAPARNVQSVIKTGPF